MTQPKRKLRVADDIAGFVRSLHPELKRKIKSALQMILADPQSGKALKDELKGLRSFRISRFRIIYKIPSKNEIAVIAVGPRKTIYEETLLLIRRNR